MPGPRELSFQLERFEWIASDRLELAGRWSGLRGRRIAPPVLAFEADGRRHRLRAMPGGQLDERWRATFAWDGPSIDIERAELEVGRALVVDLPRPRRRSSADRPAEPLEERLAAAEAEAEAAREKLGQLREDLSTAAEETEQALTAARETEAALREEASAMRTELERARGLLEQRESQLGATRAGLERERSDLRELRDRLAEAEAELARERERAAAAGEELSREHERAAAAGQELARQRERAAAAGEELERERQESRRLRERVSEPATEALTVEAASGEEWPLEPAPLPPATAAAERPASKPAPAAEPATADRAPTESAAPGRAPAAEPATADRAPTESAAPDRAAAGRATSDRATRDEAPPVPLGTRAQDAAQERSHPVTNGDAPSIEVWAARVGGGGDEGKGAGESPRTLELPGLEAVKEKGARALSSLLGHDGEEPDPVPARPRAAAASRAGTRVRPPQGTRSRTVRQHSAQAIWAMRIAAVTVLVILFVLLAVVLNVLS